ncbi:cap-specific mRNA (nucleoside-2'-O-)-methyltransferase 2 [Hetaerina americana]|uniref:cap-specific mRNA (nucleoside-2'-O-)-methyltransferase 2 n=1 Tax=Hetaerina americana TaxID=62018 RepID=UPI003A7F47E1
MELQAMLQFEKKYFFNRHHDWELPDPTTMFKDKKWAIADLIKFKDRLNEVKSKLNDFPLEKWHRHTAAMNPAGAIQRQLREEVGAELLTQAWCKFFETVCSFSLIPSKSIETKELNTVHLCEAPGAFVASLNHYLTINLPDIKWNWMATTLNPHYEANDPARTIFDDRFIIPTEKHWSFGADHTGDIQLEANMRHLLNEAKERGLSGKGTLMLVTADGSIDCQFNPGEQESLVCTLHLCEATTALLLLDKGGSLLLKAFTVFEAENVCLLYLLAFAFEKIVAWKPATSREGNSEMYLVCINYRGQSSLSPWLEVLCKYYGQEFSKAPMFSLDSIPQTFLSQVVECAEKFMNYQINVIERNIETFDARDQRLGLKGRVLTAYQSSYRIKSDVSKEFFCRYRPMPIPDEAKLLPVCQQLKSMNVFKQLHSLYDSSGQYSFNQKIRHKRQECSSLEIWETLSKALNECDTVLQDFKPFQSGENKLSVKFSRRSCKVAPLKSDLNLKDVSVGSPVKKVLISKFCHSWLLHLYEQILSLWNQLGKMPANGNQEGNMETLKSPNSEDEMLGKVKSRIDIFQEETGNHGKKGNALENDIPELAVTASTNVEHMDQNFCAYGKNSASSEKQYTSSNTIQEQILQIFTDDTASCFVWHDKMSSGNFGIGLSGLLTYLKGVEENGNLFISKVFPLLTRVEVGIIYLLSQLFHQLWFIWPSAEVNPGDERHYILMSGRHSYDENHMKILHFLEELSQLAAYEERKTSPQTLLAVVPIRLLCEKDFYKCIACMNHLILKNKAKQILSNCSEIRVLQSLQ